MIIDSSAVMAVLVNEESAEAIKLVLETSPVVRIGAPSVLEIAMVASSRLDPVGQGRLDRLLAPLEIVPFEAQDVTAARLAHERFGRGSGSPAKLNFGDCMSYAIAKRYREPLLYVGNDFAATDIDSVL